MYILLSVLHTGTVILQKGGTRGASRQRRRTLALTICFVKIFSLAQASIFEFLFAFAVARFVVPFMLYSQVVTELYGFAFTLAVTAVPALCCWITTAFVFLTRTAARVCIIILSVLVAVRFPFDAVTRALTVIVQCDCFTLLFLPNHLYHADCNLLLCCHCAVPNQLRSYTASYTPVQRHGVWNQPDARSLVEQDNSRVWATITVHWMSGVNYFWRGVWVPWKENKHTRTQFLLTLIWLQYMKFLATL